MYQVRDLRVLVRYAVEMRVLGRIRLSRLTDESTSAARQQEIIEQWAAANNHTVVGWAEDTDVSGSVDPFDTAQLGDWLSRPAEWDILCAWKLDRFGRNSIKLNKLFGWCLDNNKVLVSCSEGIDLSTPVGRLIANVIAFLAEGELEAIRERTKASRRKLLESGRWHGGVPPRGYRPVKLPSGGYKLEPDPDTAPDVRKMVHEAIEGRTVDQIAKERGQHPTVLWRVLRSPHLLGHATYNGKTVRDHEGKPVLWGEPLISRPQWDDLQAALAARRGGIAARRVSRVSPMQGVAFCPVCDKQLYHRSFDRDYGQNVYRYYYCRNKHTKAIPADKVEKLVFDTFLEEFGDDKVTKKVYRPAENHQTALEDAVRAVDELTPLLGTLTSSTMRSRVTGQLRALDLEIARLETLPTRDAGWELIETDETFKEVWESATVEEKRKLIIDHEISVRIIKRGDDIQFYLTTQKSPSTR